MKRLEIVRFRGCVIVFTLAAAVAVESSAGSSSDRHTLSAEDVGPGRVPEAALSSSPDRAPVARTDMNSIPAGTRHHSIDLSALKTKLRKTKAIGTFAKLELKRQIDEILDRFRRFHRLSERSSPAARAELDRLQSRFELLLQRVLVLLEAREPKLHRKVADARFAIWQSLVDPERFPKLVPDRNTRSGTARHRGWAMNHSGDSK